jgi:hypothetical protein
MKRNKLKKQRFITWLMNKYAEIDKLRRLYARNNIKTL